MRANSMTQKDVMEKLKQENLYLYVQNLGKTVPVQQKKKEFKGPKTGEIYKGVFDPE